MVFPRKYFKDRMIKNVPHRTVGAASTSGWITNEILFQWLIHFIRYTKPTPDSLILPIMDNHESHVTHGVIKLARTHTTL